MIDAVFSDKDGYHYNEMFSKPSQFLRAVRSRKNDVFLHAVDYTKHVIIYPSTLPNYRNSV